MTVEVEDLSAMQRILESPERKELRKEFHAYTLEVQSQIQEILV